jgi:hypothetical protein
MEDRERPDPRRCPGAESLEEEGRLQCCQEIDMIYNCHYDLTVLTV